MAVDDGGGQWQRMTTARKIRQQTTTGKVESRWRTMTALDGRDGEDDVVFGGGHTVFCCEYFFFGGGGTIFFVWEFC
jgi:hypothetical protein